MTQYGFFFDSTRCTGCRTCEMACKDYKDLSATIAFRKVYDYEGGAWSDVGDGTELRQLLHVQIFLYQHLLNLIADQHMETVAQFIGLGAD